MIIFVTNNLHFSCVGSFYSSLADFTTYLGLQMFSLMDAISENSCQTWDNTLQNIKKYFCCKSYHIDSLNSNRHQLSDHYSANCQWQIQPFGHSRYMLSKYPMSSVYLCKNWLSEN